MTGEGTVAAVVPHDKYCGKERTLYGPVEHHASPIHRGIGDGGVQRCEQEIADDNLNDVLEGVQHGLSDCWLETMLRDHTFDVDRGRKLLRQRDALFQPLAFQLILSRCFMLTDVIDDAFSESPYEEPHARHDLKRLDYSHDCCGKAFISYNLYFL